MWECQTGERGVIGISNVRSPLFVLLTHWHLGLQQESSLCLAAQGGDVQEARRLLENQDLGEEERLDLVNQRNEQHHAAIHLACAAGNM